MDFATIHSLVRHSVRTEKPPAQVADIFCLLTVVFSILLDKSPEVMEGGDADAIEIFSAASCLFFLVLALSPLERCPQNWGRDLRFASICSCSCPQPEMPVGVFASSTVICWKGPGKLDTGATVQSSSFLLMFFCLFVSVLSF